MSGSATPNTIRSSGSTLSMRFEEEDKSSAPSATISLPKKQKTRTLWHALKSCSCVCGSSKRKKSTPTTSLPRSNSSRLSLTTTGILKRRRRGKRWSSPQLHNGILVTSDGSRMLPGNTGSVTPGSLVLDADGNLLGNLLYSNVKLSDGTKLLCEPYCARLLANGITYLTDGTLVLPNKYEVVRTADTSIITAPDGEKAIKEGHLIELPDQTILWPDLALTVNGVYLHPKNNGTNHPPSFPLPPSTTDTIIKPSSRPNARSTNSSGTIGSAGSFSILNTNSGSSVAPTSSNCEGKPVEPQDRDIVPQTRDTSDIEVNSDAEAIRKGNNHSETTFTYVTNGQPAETHNRDTCNQDDIQFDSVRTDVDLEQIVDYQWKPRSSNAPKYLAATLEERESALTATFDEHESALAATLEERDSASTNDEFPPLTRAQLDLYAVQGGAGPDKDSSETYTVKSPLAPV